jgi:hypothetical protein
MWAWVVLIRLSTPTSTLPYTSLRGPNLPPGQWLIPVSATRNFSYYACHHTVACLLAIKLQGPAFKIDLQHEIVLMHVTVTVEATGGGPGRIAAYDVPSYAMHVIRTRRHGCADRIVVSMRTPGHTTGT